MRLRSARTRSAGGSATVRRGSSASPRTWERTSFRAASTSRPSCVRSALISPRPSVSPPPAAIAPSCRRASYPRDQPSRKPSANGRRRGRGDNSRSSGCRPACPGRDPPGPIRRSLLIPGATGAPAGLATICASMLSRASSAPGFPMARFMVHGAEKPRRFPSFGTPGAVSIR